MSEIYVGLLRDIMQYLDAIIFFIYFEVAVLFWSRAFKGGQGRSVNLTWGLMFTCFGITQFLQMMGTYYASIEVYNASEYYFGAWGMILIVVIVWVFEYLYQRFRQTRFTITLIGIGISIMYFLEQNEVGRFIANGYIGLLFFFLLSFFWKLIRLSTGVVRKNIILFTFAFFALLLGDVFSDPSNMIGLLSTGNDPAIMGLVGKILKISAILVMFLVLEKLPIFMEVNWQENLLQIFIIHRTAGIPIFHENFKESSSTKPLAEELVAGGMVGITAMLKEISQSSESIKLFDHGDVKILCEYGKHILIVLYVSIDYHIYRDKLVQVRASVEELFKSTLESWSGGNIAIFAPINVLVAKVFKP